MRFARECGIISGYCGKALLVFFGQVSWNVSRR
jgi:hypothetical protein